MDTLTLILIATCAVLCCAVAWLCLRRPASTAVEVDIQPQLDEKEKVISELKAERCEFESKAEERIAQLKESNTKALKESADRIAQLESEIAQAIEGGADEIVRKKLAEVDELLKKIENLEYDLDEAKDEVKDLKKHNKKLQTDKSAKEKELEDEVRNRRKLLVEINEAKVRLDRVQKDFELRGESLDFVTEILTAEHSSDQSVRDLYQTVDGIVDYIKTDVKETVTSILDIDHESKKSVFGSDVDAWALSRKKSWIQGKTSIAFVGEFSAGKTSIVNRILSQDDPNVLLLPVSTKATTAIPTYISGGVSTFFQFVTPDNELKGISERTFKRVSKEVLDQVKGVSSLIQYFVMTYKNPYLDRLSILDTPGFSSNDNEDAERTIGVINECDALFWVIDVNAGTTNSESIKTIKNHLTKPLYVVINQIDTKSKSDVDDSEKHIRKTLQDEGIEIEGIIRFSKKEPLQNIMSPIMAIKHNNERELYLNELLIDLTELEKNLSKETQNAHRECNRIENQHRQLISSFEKAVGGLAADCETVSEIPQYNSRFWSANDYRITQEQYGEFTSLLDSIRDTRLNSIISSYNDQIATVSELQEAWINYLQIKDNYRRVSECLKTLQSKAKQLDSVTQPKFTNTHTAPKPQTKAQPKAAPNSAAKQDLYAQQHGEQNGAQGKRQWTIEDVNNAISHLIIDNKRDEVWIEWPQLLVVLKHITGKEISGNAVRKYFPKFGIKNFVSRRELAYALTNLLNDKM